MKSKVNYFKKGLILALLYFAVGRLSLFLAIPPGYATAVWPAAGIALAFLLIYGGRLWPAVFISSFLLNLTAASPAEGVSGWVLPAVTAFWIAAGAALQAAWGRWLVKKLCPNLHLTQPADIGKLLLCGALSCFCNSTIGSLTLYLSGLIPSQAFLSSWFTWFAGDAIGVVLFTPVVLAWVMEDKAWRHRRDILSTSLLITTLVLVLVFWMGYDSQQKRLKAEVGSIADRVTLSLEAEINKFHLSLNAVHTFFDSSQFVSREEFGSFTRHLMRDVEGIKSIAWAPVVKADEVESFLQKARSEGLIDYFIKEVGPTGILVPAGRREVYFPLFYLEPFESNQVALGIDNGSEEGRRNASEKAIRENRVIATPPIILGQDRESGLKSILLVRSIYHHDRSIRTAEERKKNLLGFVTATVRVKDVVEGTHQSLSRSEFMNLEIIDESGNNPEIVFSTSISSGKLYRKIKEDRRINIGGRVWKISMIPTLTFYSSHFGWSLWMLMFGALLLASLLNAFALILTGYTLEVSRLVDEKTEELLTAKNALSAEHDERGKLIENLQHQKKDLEEQRSAMIVLMEDLEEQRQQIENQRTVLEKVNRELDSFVYTASHDLRTPLRGISSMASFLEKDYAEKLDEAGKGYLNEIRKSINKMSSLIEDLLKLSRVSRVMNPCENADMNSLFDAVTDRLEYEIRSNSVEIDVQKNMPQVYCDRIKMTEVFYNLVSNAVKFSSGDSSKAPRVEIFCRELSDGYEFSVRDNGIGIEKKYHEKIFGLFKRLHGDEAYDGTGAGLNIVKKILEDQGGEIRVESEPGKGSVFHVMLPKRRPESKPQGGEGVAA